MENFVLKQEMPTFAVVFIFKKSKTMKKTYLMMFLFIGLALTSCDNEDKIVYSCDQAKNDWVHENLDEIRCMTRAQWDLVSEGLKKPVYAAFTPEQRVNFWMEKLYQTLLLDWNDEERVHIQSLILWLEEKPQFLKGYNKLTDEEKDEMDSFSYLWIEKAQKELGWSNATVAGLVLSGNKMLDKSGTLQTVSSVGTRATRAESSCDCTINDDFCAYFNPGLFGECMKAKCKVVEEDCGWLWQKDCDGECGGV